MPLLQLHEVGKYYGGHDVLKSASASLEPGERVALVGANGTGKTTLLRLILGLEELTSGAIDKPREVRVGYLPQDAPDILESTVWEMAHEVFRELIDQEERLAHLAEEMARPGCPPATIERYGKLQTAYENAGGQAYVHRIEAVLTGLGFAEDRWHVPLAQFSGGWRTRALLARLLLEEPDLLMLDEPTNNLDLDTVRWLEQYLQGIRCALLLVSHDRYFLDRLCTKVWELTQGRLETYRGNYTSYRKQRQARYEQRLKEYEQQQEFIAKEEEFIRRHLAGQRTKEAQGRRTRLARFREREEIPKPIVEKTTSLRFHAGRRCSDVVLEVRDLRAGYSPAKPLFTVPRLELRRGERLAIVGPNGVGKSTLLKTLLGQLEPLGGSYQFGTNVEPGYLDQSHDVLEPEMTLVDAVRARQERKDQLAARNLLGSLLFSGDTVHQQVRDLSGGQRARLALACLALPQPNLLILDEPTNHLDIPTMEMLQAALLAYQGTILMVSHDRYLVQALATRLLVLEGGQAREFLGTWEDYVGGIATLTGAEQRPGEDADPSAASQAPGETSPRREPTPSTGRAQFEREKRRQSQQRRRQKRYDETEARIHELEDEKRMLEHALARASENAEVNELQRLTAQYQALDSQLTDLYDTWAQLADQLQL